MTVTRTVCAYVEQTLGMQLHMQAIGTLLEPKFHSAA
jgi:hypothetical protein